MIYKRYGFLSFKDWFIDAGTIAAGSADKAVNGMHYYRHMRLQKESFDALVQYRVDEIANVCCEIDQELVEKLCLRRDPSPQSLQAILSMEAFQRLSNEIVSPSGPQAKMTIEYLKDVSSLLALVSSLREGDIERLLPGEREIC